MAANMANHTDRQVPVNGNGTGSMSTRTPDASWSRTVTLLRSILSQRCEAPIDESIASTSGSGTAGDGESLPVDSGMLSNGVGSVEASVPIPTPSAQVLTTEVTRIDDGKTAFDSQQVNAPDESSLPTQVSQEDVIHPPAKIEHHAVTSHNLASRALGPRRSGRMSRVGGAESSNINSLLHIDPPDSLLSLNTTTTLTPPTQADGGGNGLVLPRWTIPIARLTLLQTLITPGRSRARRGDYIATSPGVPAQRCSVIVCVVSVEPTAQRQRKEEKARGAEGTLWIGGWKVVGPPSLRGGAVGGDAEVDEVSCEVKLWDGIAREWDGQVRRGDVILLENVEFKPAGKDSPTLSASPHPSARLCPRITILYRTIPRRINRGMGDYQVAQITSGEKEWVAEDRMLRPDLRLERSDMGVRRVKEVAVWFARWVGGEPPV